MHFDQEEEPIEMLRERLRMRLQSRQTLDMVREVIVARHGSDRTPPFYAEFEPLSVEIKRLDVAIQTAARSELPQLEARVNAVLDRLRELHSPLQRPPP